MAGDEDKKKKKKTKKATDEAPPPAPEPEPAPAPPPPVAEGDDNDDWLSAATAEEPTPAQGSDETPAEGEYPAEGEVPAEGEEVPLGEEGELPPQPKKKPKFFVHWDRRKARFYDYNFDYGTNYYSSMVGYVDQKNTVFSTQGSATVPRRMAFAERGMYSSLERSRNPDIKTQSLLNDVRSSIRNFETSQRVYAYGSNRKKY